MSTYINEGSDTMFWLFLAIGIPLIIGAFISATHDGNIRQQQHDKAPCSSFGQLTLDKVPARCITPDGGFNGK